MLILLKLFIFLFVPCVMFIIPVRTGSKKVKNNNQTKRSSSNNISVHKQPNTVLAQPQQPKQKPSSSTPVMSDDFDITSLIEKSKEENDFL